MNIPKQILPLIVISQFCCTSLWFAGNGVMGDLVNNFNLDNSALGHLTSAVQFGFITGTFFSALLTIADRFSPSRIFFVSACVAAFFNLSTVLEINTLYSLLGLRFMTGFFLAGIYPIGMKIAADYFEKGLGKSLSFLVGALVLGTAFPHLLKEFTSELPWRLVLMITSSLAVFGGLLILIFVPNGPFRKESQQFDLSIIFKVFKNIKFRSAAFGYFGHMWELYAFWTFVPMMLILYKTMHSNIDFNVSLFSFIIIGIGGLACVMGGYLSQQFGAKKIAFISLMLSGICCLISPFIFHLASPQIFLLYLILWGMVVIADSPLFSTLVAQNATPESKGTALTIVTCIGFFITIFSIQLLTHLTNIIEPQYIFIALGIGPLFGLIALK